MIINYAQWTYKTNNPLKGLSVTLTFGDQVISNTSETGEIEQVADQFFIHKDYNSKKALNDIALIRLYKPVRLGPTINPACLADKDEVLYEGRTCYIAGWGAEDERYSNGFVSDHLLEAPVPIITDSTCQQTKSYGRIFRPENHLCAGYMSGGQNDACQNDSGLIFRTNLKKIFHKARYSDRSN